MNSFLMPILLFIVFLLTIALLKQMVNEPENTVNDIKNLNYQQLPMNLLFG